MGRASSYTDTSGVYPLLVPLAVVLLVPLLFPHLYDNPTAWQFSLFSEWVPPRIRHVGLLNSVAKARLNHEESRDLWTPPKSGAWRPCISSKNTHTEIGDSVGYLQVFLEGGLNQQRMGICDAVALAVLLNVTLVLPHFDLNPVWKDPSSFADIFDVDHFIRSLRGVVRIVKELPEDYRWSTREYYATGVRPTRVKTAPSLASPEWYTTNVSPLLLTYGIVAIAPFSHRLAFDGIPDEVQKLRCRVNFEALKFVPAISTLGHTIVQRLHHITDLSEVFVTKKDMAAKDNLDRALSFKYVALHLRFDKDMAAHSACDFGGGKAERLALAKYRQIFWQGRVKKSLFSADHLRQHGKCPLTPEEIGIGLSALGFGNSTRVYLASHKVYGGEARMSALRQLFPFLMDKSSLSTVEELKPFQGKASLLAALDYYVSLHSDVFISASPGNMHNALVGHRTFREVQKTIRPDMKLFAQLFANATISWEDFRRAAVQGHEHRLGQVRLRQPKQSLYTYPAPDCVCRW